jgi:cytochrome c oxidase subunit 4
MAQATANEPTTLQYWIIGLILAMVTAIEVAVVYIDALDSMLFAILFTLAAIKFALVARWYMHLKFDKPLYSKFFLIGIFGAVAMFTVVLATFGVTLAS